MDHAKKLLRIAKTKKAEWLIFDDQLFLGL